MKRSKQFATLMLLVGGMAFVSAGCNGDGDHVNSSSTMPDHPHADHPNGDHPSADHPTSSSDHPHAEHPSDHPKGDHPS